MITWTVTTRPDHSLEKIIAAGAESSLDTAKQGAADAIRYALLGAADDTAECGTPPTYLVKLDGKCALIVGLGTCAPSQFNAVLDALELFDGSAPRLVYL